MGLFGGNWKKKWPILAERLGVEIGSSKEGPYIESIYRKHDMHLYSYAKGGGTNIGLGGGGGFGLSIERRPDEHFTRLTVKLLQPKDFWMIVDPKNLLRVISKKFGKVYVQLDGTQFDKKYMIQGDDLESIRNVLTPEIQQKILGVKRFHMKIKDNSLSFEEKGHVKDIDRLQSLIDVFVDIAERIEKLQGLNNNDITWGVPVEDGEVNKEGN